MISIDMEKVYDEVPREILWWVMLKKLCYVIIQFKMRENRFCWFGHAQRRL